MNHKQANSSHARHTGINFIQAQLQRRGFPLGMLLVMMISACSSDVSPYEAPLVQVSILVAERKPADNVVEFPGRVQAVRTAEVRARVNGIVERRLYEEGVDVLEGQKLFQIDPRELRANVNAVKASLAGAKATVANAEQDVDRYKGLVAEQAISEQEYDAAVARLRTAQANEAQVTAQLESAQLSLSFATVTAPIEGRAGRAQVTEGALVSASAATLLTTIEQLDPVYVNFSQSSSDLLRTRREIAQGTLQLPELQRISLKLLLEDGSEYQHTGHLDFFNLSIDQATGTVALRAEFPNPDQSLVPGQFVRARIDAGVRPEALLIPQRAIQLSPQGASLMIVDDNNVVGTRSVSLGDLYDDFWLVTEGLSGGERVIIDGLQKVQPGQTVSIMSVDSTDAAGQAQ